MIKIAIIELETHAHLVEQWDSFFMESKIFDSHFFLSRKISNKVKLKNKTTIINNINYELVKEYDLIIINTFHRHFSDYSEVLKKKKCLILVHNVNFSYNFNKINFGNLFQESFNNILYFLKIYNTERIGKERKLIKYSSYLAILSQSIEQNFQLKKNQVKLINLNYLKFNKIIFKEKIKIVIPGNISKKRKDLKLIFIVLQKLNPVSELEFTFLGKPENQNIINLLNKAKSSVNKKVTINFFTDYVSQIDFENEIKECHFLFCPILQKTSFYLIDEFYGKSKVSGNEGDCITYGKVGIFPSIYPNFNWHTINYSNESELVDFFNKLDEEKIEIEYDKLKPFYKKYTMEKVYLNLKENLLSCIK